MPIIKSEYIRRKLSYIKSIVEDDTKQKLYDINTLSEYIFMQILNDVYGWSLINANDEKPNFPAIDLIDTVNETVFQVTSEISTKKVREETIEKFNELVKQVEYKKYAHYKIKMFYIKNKPNFSDKILEEFESKGVPKSHLYGIEDINREVSANPIIATKVFKTLCKILHDKVCDSDTPPNLTTKSSTHDSSFIGREDEVKAIDKMLESSNSLLLINGIGGIGKSSLANHYLYTREKKFDYYGFIDGLDSFISEFRNSLDLKTQKEEELYREIISKLQGLQGKKLLVIDNVENIESHKNLIEMLVSLPKYNYKILFTSRRKIKNIEFYPLGTLLLVDAQKLFLNCFKKEERAKLDKSKVDKIIKYLGRHTLFIKLVAETIENEGYSLDYILEKFEDKNGGLSKIDYIDDESGDKVTFNQNLQELFSMQNLKDEYVLLLKRLAVLPSIDIELSFLEEILGKELLQGRLNFLVSRGWLIENNGSYKLHQIIKEFMLANYAPCFEEIKVIIDYFIRFMSIISEEQASLENISYIIYLQSIYYVIKKMNIIDEKLDVFIGNLGGIFLNIGDYDKAIIFHSESLKMRKEILGEYTIATAIGYNNLGSAYGKIPNYYSKATYCMEKAFKISKKIKFDNHPIILKMINNLIALYLSKEDTDKAFFFINDNIVEKNKKIFGENNSKLIPLYMNLGAFYLFKNEYEKAFDFLIKSLKLSQDIYSENHITTVRCYENLMNFFLKKFIINNGENLDDKKNIKLYMKKSKEIKEKILPKNHPELLLGIDVFEKIEKVIFQFEITKEDKKCPTNPHTP